MARRWQVGLVGIACAWLSLAPAHAAGPDDRLDRFRELAATRLGAAQLVDGTAPAEAYRDVYALLDEEIVENLASGSVFASPAFIQDRLDAFSDVWGGASFRLLPLGPLLVGAFHLGDGEGGGSVRVYGKLRGEPALLGALARDGSPLLYPQPSAPGGVAQFLIAWEGAASGRGTRALRLELVRADAQAPQVAWTTAKTFPEGLIVRAWRVRGSEVDVRYELHYAGWTPGCDDETEAEDVYRLVPARSTFVRASQRLLNGWHLSLHRAVGRLVDALREGKAADVARLVPSPALRRSLPTALRVEPGCDAREAGKGETVSVPATAGEGEPWTLVWRRAGEAWTLVAATRVIE